MLSKILNVVNFYRAWKHGNRFKPIHVSLYPTYRCNLKYVQKPKEKTYMLNGCQTICRK